MFRTAKDIVPSYLDEHMWSEQYGKTADCCHCVKKKISGGMLLTSNFLRHLKVSCSCMGEGNLQSTNQ